VTSAVVALAAELRAGQPPSAALLISAGSPPVWPSTLAALRLDSDIPEALRVDAQAHPVLRSLAACWEVGSASGSGLAAAVHRLAEASRAAEEVRGELEVQLAGPRATARTLATLPLIGLLLGVLMGADPVGWLLGSALGLGCLAGGAVLTGLGILWTSRIAAGVERQL
jgi:tight adherence protein B